MIVIKYLYRYSPRKICFTIKVNNLCRTVVRYSLELITYSRHEHSVYSILKYRWI
uniref:Uncharacterized protein n=1 Tax=Podoviridae sp. ctG4L18 TaxID=2825234 RepID=A0A8S5UP62_9CAUD|nr:MAG TPA: hypothetical protein [Podoviridae sp. ctG4L18]